MMVQYCIAYLQCTAYWVSQSQVLEMCACSPQKCIPNRKPKRKDCVEYNWECTCNLNIIHCTYLTDAGNSLITKNSGQISVFDDLKMLTPSVLIMKETFAGLQLLGHKNPPGLACLEYSLPSYISFIDELCFGLVLSMLQKSLSKQSIRALLTYHNPGLHQWAVPLNFDLNCSIKSVVIKYSMLFSPWQYTSSSMGIRHTLQ